MNITIKFKSNVVIFKQYFSTHKGNKSGHRIFSTSNIENILEQACPTHGPWAACGSQQLVMQPHKIVNF